MKFGLKQYGYSVLLAAPLVLMVSGGQFGVSSYYLKMKLKNVSGAVAPQVTEVVSARRLGEDTLQVCLRGVLKTAGSPGDYGLRLTLSHYNGEMDSGFLREDIAPAMERQLHAEAVVSNPQRYRDKGLRAMSTMGYTVFFPVSGLEQGCPSQTEGRSVLIAQDSSVKPGEWPEHVTLPEGQAEVLFGPFAMDDAPQAAFIYAGRDLPRFDIWGVFGEKTLRGYSPNYLVLELIGQLQYTNEPLRKYLPLAIALDIATAPIQAVLSIPATVLLYFFPVA